ncbi:MAG TPA: class I SAM-dependent methyltransferase [Chthoniobacterales bacterium]|jgi:predicted O-methyltransferase YrrM
MEDALLHLSDAVPSWKHFRRLRGELTGLIEGMGASAESLAAARLDDACSGKINFPDAYILKRLLERYRPATILEVGSFVGFSTRWLLENSAGWNAKLTAVDPNIRHRSVDDPGEILRAFNAQFLPERLEVIEGFFGAPGACYHDYETFEPKQDRAFVDRLIAQRQHIGPGWERRFDFIFIDGDHGYKAVKENFEIAVDCLNPNGCIAFHDVLSWAGVRQALDEIKQNFAGRAEVKIFGRLDRSILQGIFGKTSSGIGFFRFKPGQTPVSSTREVRAAQPA